MLQAVTRAPLFLAALIAFATSTAFAGDDIVAFFVPKGGYCAVDAVVWNNTNRRYLIAKFWPHTADLAERIRTNLGPGQALQIDSDQGDRLDLRCDDKAVTLKAVRAAGVVASASSAP